MNGEMGNNQCVLLCFFLFPCKHMFDTDSFCSIYRNWHKYANEEYENMVDDSGLLNEEDARNG